MHDGFFDPYLGWLAHRCSRALGVPDRDGLRPLGARVRGRRDRGWGRIGRRGHVEHLRGRIDLILDDRDGRGHHHVDDQQLGRGLDDEQHEQRWRRGGHLLGRRGGHCHGCRGRGGRCILLQLLQQRRRDRPAWAGLRVLPERLQRQERHLLSCRQPQVWLWLGDAVQRPTREPPRRDVRRGPLRAGRVQAWIRQLQHHPRLRDGPLAPGDLWSVQHRVRSRAGVHLDRVRLDVRVPCDQLRWRVRQHADQPPPLWSVLHLLSGGGQRRCRMHQRRVSRGM
jgi:hypothetical protein